MKKILSMLILALLMTSSLALAETIKFKDVPKEAWYEKYVYDLSAKGIIKGYTNGNFGPQDNLRVSELVAMVTRIVTGGEIEPIDQTWYSGYIEKAKELEIVKDKEFDDYNRYITRGEIARIIIRALEEEYPTDIDKYKETIKDYNNINKNLQEYILKAYTKGIVNGYPDGNFKSEGKATRAEASSIIMRYIDPSQRVEPKEPSKGNLSKEFQEIIDNVPGTFVGKAGGIIHSDDGTIEIGKVNWVLGKEEYGLVRLLTVYEYDNKEAIDSIEIVLKQFYKTEYKNLFKEFKKIIAATSEAPVEDGPIASFEGYYDNRYIGIDKFSGGTSISIGRVGVKY